jgi:hypothetical protein
MVGNEGGAMANPAPKLPDGRRVIDAMSIGVLTKTYPIAKIKAVLGSTGRTSVRERALPAHVVIYYVLCLTLCTHLSVREVLRWMLEGVQWLLSPRRYEVSVKSAITQARQRLGWEPLRQLHDEVVGPMARKETRGAWYRQWRVVSLDGSTMEVADTPENAEEFGRQRVSRGETAYPQLRFVALVENGTHGLFATQMGSYGTGEIPLARQVIQGLQEGMLCLADREFLGYELWNLACGQGADLLWRARKNLRLECVQRLADGSYLSVIYPSPQDRLRRTRGVGVRVIEYRLEGMPDSQPFYRLLTTILDPQQAPAEELAALYHERWEIETTLDEFKVHLRGARWILRSKTPDLVRQEFYGFLLTHFAIRALMHEAALSAQEDPDRLSFTHAVRVLRRALPRFHISPLRRIRSLASGRAAGDSRRTSQQQSRSARATRSEAKDKPVSVATSGAASRDSHRSWHQNA